MIDNELMLMWRILKQKLEEHGVREEVKLRQGRRPDGDVLLWEEEEEERASAGDWEEEDVYGTVKFWPGIDYQCIDLYWLWYPSDKTIVIYPLITFTLTNDLWFCLLD